MACRALRMTLKGVAKVGEGIARVVAGLVGSSHYRSYRAPRSRGFEADAQSLASDWEKVGNDLWNALGKIEDEAMNMSKPLYGDTNLLGCFRENPEMIADYLNCALEEGKESFLLALKDVVLACGSPAFFSQKTGLNHFSVNGIFSGKPTPESVAEVLKALKLKFSDKLENHIVFM